MRGEAKIKCECTCVLTLMIQSNVTNISIFTRFTHVVHVYGAIDRKMRLFQNYDFPMRINYWQHSCTCMHVSVGIFFYACDVYL